jgi:predicted MFS family arabinose efflux permease
MVMTPRSLGRAHDRLDERGRIIPSADDAERRRREASVMKVARILFLALFAAQAAVIVVSPVLGAVAADLGVSTATAGQLRTVSGLAAAATALGIPHVSRRLGLRAILLFGTALTAVGSLASAGAPTFAALAVAQVAVGIGIAALVSAGTTAAAAWVPEEQRARVLSWALIGQPAAWIVGMPLVGALGQFSWRWGWVALPFTSSLAAALLLTRRHPDPPGSMVDARVRTLLADRSLARWALAELLAMCGWAGTLVYAGALLTDSYGVSAFVTGALLAFGAVAYVAGNLAMRRFADSRPRRRLVLLSFALAVSVTLFGVVRPNIWTSAGLFAVAGALAGARTLTGSVVGLRVAPERRLTAMGIRTAATQLGYFIGAAVGGISLAARGYAGVGTTLGVFFVAAGAALARPPRTRGLEARPEAIGA